MEKHRTLKIIGIVLVFAILFFVVVNVIPPAKNVENNPFVVAQGELPKVAAHRGGAINHPENTMLAFREAVAMGVDILESDLYLTKDGYLVYNHDEYIDDTCNVNGDIPHEQAKENRHYIKDMTLAELQQYNFGYYFTDASGNRPYAQVEDIEAAGLQMATVDQLFEEFYQANPDLLFIVEIKDEGDRGREACRILSETLAKYPAYAENIVVGTFHDEIEQELKTNYPDLLRGAPTGTAASFILTQFLGVNLFDRGDFACLQIPMSYDVGITLNLDKQTIIDRAHKRNIAVQYWTINDPDEMRTLIELGCDAIMTDNPALLIQILEEYQTN